MAEKNPIRETDDDARAHARALLYDATHGALAVLDPETGAPGVTRIALAPDMTFGALTLISDLSPHTQALRQDPRSSVLVGEPGPKGDPLTHPRLTVAMHAEFISKDSEDHTTTRAHWLKLRPKSKLYIDFGDFHLVRLIPQSAALNGGFGKAFHLTADDLKA